MPTLIHHENARGDRHDCDARCYNGHGRKCQCICGGRNHGVGLQRARENMTPDFKAKLQNDHPILHLTFEPPEHKQRDLLP